MLINIINYEAALGVKEGILTKIANRLNDGLIKLGEDSKVSEKPDPNADVNHHMVYSHFKKPGGGVNTLMVTHFLDGQQHKVDMLKKALEASDMGICFSKHGMMRFVDAGIPADRLTYILPAHDGQKRRPWVVTISTKIYGDGRKREGMITELFKVIDKNKFVFRIMGGGWQPIIDSLRKQGFDNIDYFENFNLELHKTILDSSDFLLYAGEDEGAISVLDAANAGVKIITTPQGYHCEIGIDYPFNTQEELNSIFKKLEENRVENWTWDRYTRQHLELWKQLLAKK